MSLASEAGSLAGAAADIVGRIDTHGGMLCAGCVERLAVLAAALEVHAARVANAEVIIRLALDPDLELLDLLDIE
jgi:hypothetical protein